MNTRELNEDRRFHWSGIYRGKCIDTKDPNKQGRIKVWIPDVMPEIDETKGIWARPANNPLGGRNDKEDGDDHHYQGSCMIPPSGSWLYIFFENGDPSEPRYMAALDQATTKGGDTSPSVPDECQQGSEYWKKWIPIKTREGRVIIFSDDKDDERVEITGKKRTIAGPPDGDGSSVYKIDGNQTVILLDERVGKEKILLRTHMGDYIHIDVNQQMLQCYFKNDIRIQTDGNLHINVAKNYTLNTGMNRTETTGMNKHETVAMNYHRTIGVQDHELVGNKKFLATGDDYNRTIGKNDNEFVAMDRNIITGKDYNLDSAATNINSNKAKAAIQPPAIPAVPNIVMPGSKISTPPGPTPGIGPVLPLGDRDE